MKADHKQALATAQKADDYYSFEETENLVAAYLEMRELAQASLKAAQLDYETHEEITEAIRANAALREALK